MELAAGEHRLEHLRGVHRALGRTRADDRVQLVDEEDDLAVRLRDLLQHRFEPFLELAPILGAGHQRAHVEREDPLLLQALGNVAAHDALRQPFDDGRLADARLTDEHRVVLRAARQHLDHAADFLVAADDRIELALLGQLGEIAAIAGERLVGRLRLLRGHALVPADHRQRGVEGILGDAGLLQHLCGRGAPGLAGECDEQVLGADVLVLQALRFGLRRVENQLHAWREAHLGAIGLRHLLQ